MLEWMRVTFGPVLIGIIISFIAVVFVFYGVFSPKSTRGLHSGTVAGVVNGDSISLSEFNRALNQRIEFFKQMTGGTVTEEQIKNFRIKEGVFNELVNRKLLSQEALRMGLQAGDEEVKERIRQMDVFQKDGKFNPTHYSQVLTANNFTPSSFERMMRDDLLMQHMSDYLKGRARVTDEEVRREFLVSHQKRNIKFVLLTPESGKKGLKISVEEIKKYLSDSTKLNLVKSRFESSKDTEFKGKKFEEAKEKIAEAVLASEKHAEIKKINDDLAEQILGLIKVDKAADSRINTLLKPFGVEVKTTGMVNRSQKFLPGMGDAGQILAEAFDKKNPINPVQGGKPKKYNLPSGVVVALVSESETPDLSKLEGEREKLMKQLVSKKEQDLYESFLKQATKKAKIEKNAAVVEGKDEPVYD